MTQLGLPLPEKLLKIRGDLCEELKKRKISELDANSSIKGRDFLSKIWRQVLGVPMGIAIITEEMKVSTISNIFYEVGVLNAFGKETIVIKSKEFSIPSDFIRTEYIEYDENFKEKINKFLDEIDELADHYDLMGEELEANPVLTIDYFKRAYLINGNPTYFKKVKDLSDKENFDIQTRYGIKNFLATEKMIKKKELKK
ncbi:MAG: hypothetical protein RBR68_12060 [Tenuifilaceae bacterium]|jgi:hypothetical protein|nr:hypothetical protein [Tenuifilaceae bacterium]